MKPLSLFLSECVQKNGRGGGGGEWKSFARLFPYYKRIHGFYAWTLIVVLILLFEALSTFLPTAVADVNSINLVSLIVLFTYSF